METEPKRFDSIAIGNRRKVPAQVGSALCTIPSSGHPRLSRCGADWLRVCMVLIAVILDFVLRTLDLQVQVVDIDFRSSRYASTCRRASDMTCAFLQ